MPIHSLILSLTIQQKRITPRSIHMQIAKHVRYKNIRNGAYFRASIAKTITFLLTLTLIADRLFYFVV